MGKIANDGSAAPVRSGMGMLATFQLDWFVQHKVTLASAEFWFFAKPFGISDTEATVCRASHRQSSGMPVLTGFQPLLYKR